MESRIKLHNEHYHKKAFTKSASDWKIILKFECKSKKEALFLEKFIKRMKSKKFVEKIIENPHILDDILSKQ
jgi:putative endonuclease